MQKVLFSHLAKRAHIISWDNQTDIDIDNPYPYCEWMISHLTDWDTGHELPCYDNTNLTQAIFANAVPFTYGQYLSEECFEVKGILPMIKDNNKDGIYKYVNTAIDFKAQVGVAYQKTVVNQGEADYYNKVNATNYN